MSLVHRGRGHGSGDPQRPPLVEPRLDADHEAALVPDQDVARQPERVEPVAPGRPIEEERVRGAADPEALASVDRHRLDGGPGRRQLDE